MFYNTAIKISCFIQENFKKLKGNCKKLKGNCKVNTNFKGISGNLQRNFWKFLKKFKENHEKIAGIFFFNIKRILKNNKFWWISNKF